MKTMESTQKEKHCKRWKTNEKQQKSKGNKGKPEETRKPIKESWNIEGPKEAREN